MQKQWKIRKHDRGKAESLASSMGIHPLTAALLISRGVDTEESARRFLKPDISHLHPPRLLADMDIAVGRILEAAEKRQKILVWGDYDVDGTTGTALLRKALKQIGAESEYYIPNRFSEGYGINIPALKAALERGCDVAITVDCGTRSFEAAAWARENGLDLIVTDHHEPDEKLGFPPAFAFINPRRRDCSYPDKNLAGVGVAFKLAEALLRNMGRDTEVAPLLKIAAIGTVADVMDLSGENRAIVTLGLRDLRNTSNLGLKALMEVADCRSDMTSGHIAYRIGPRINAAGRMNVATDVVELLEAEDFTRARKLAGILNDRNRERQRMQEQITESALFETHGLLDHKFVVVAGEGWHRGVIGLAASRLAERLYRPTVVLSVENGKAHGSGRSIPGFNLLESLDSCSDLFDQYGGHAAAAGMTISSENIEKLRSRLNHFAQNVFGEGEIPQHLEIDAPVSSQSLSLDLIREIEMLEPFGAGNPRPLFATGGLFLRDDPFVMKEKHLKLHVEDSNGKRFEAVWWNGVEKSSGQTLKAGIGIELAYTAELNTWQGNTRLQLVIEDLKSDN